MDNRQMNDNNCQNIMSKFLKWKWFNKCFVCYFPQNLFNELKLFLDFSYKYVSFFWKWFDQMKQTSVDWFHCKYEVLTSNRSILSTWFRWWKTRPMLDWHYFQYCLWFFEILLKYFSLVPARTHEIMKYTGNIDLTNYKCCFCSIDAIRINIEKKQSKWKAVVYDL